MNHGPRRLRQQTRGVTDYEGVDMWSLRGPRACPSNLKRTFPRKGIVCGLPKGHIGEHAWESGESWVRWNEHRGGVYISSSRLR